VSIRGKAYDLSYFHGMPDKTADESRESDEWIANKAKKIISASYPDCSLEFVVLKKLRPEPMPVVEVRGAPDDSSRRAIELAIRRAINAAADEYPLKKES